MQPASATARPLRAAARLALPKQPLGCLLLAAVCLLGPAACSERTTPARTLSVGPDREFKTPSEAVAEAEDGDTIAIQPGEYADCAVVDVSRVTIEGEGAGVVLADKTCEGKAILVTVGHDITVRNLTLTRARVPDANGAGIRAEGANLTVENVRFIDNENGILAAPSPDSTIRIVASEFLRNGTCEQACAHGIYVNDLALLRIERSTFSETRDGHHVKSRAQRTELIDNVITDGQNGTASYLVDVPNGGALVMEGNRLEKGPQTGNQSAAIVIGAEGVSQETAELVVRNNKFTNDSPVETIFVRNLTATPAQLTGNVLAGKVVPLTGDGTVR
jgi:hypothetical protein